MAIGYWIPQVSPSKSYIVFPFTDSVQNLEAARPTVTGELANTVLTPLGDLPTNNVTATVDVRKLTFPCKTKSKRYFCLFCKKFIVKLERHLRAKHRHEEQVKAFATLPKESAERKKLVSNIRKEGNYIHNTNPKYNTGTLITCRRQLSRNTNTVSSYIHCPHCKGSFAKNNIRHHYQKCNTEYKPNRREVGVMGRYLEGYVHHRASEGLKKFVLPYFQDDEIRSLIVYDELIILMGNHFVQTYAEGWQRMRSDMRYLAKLKKELLKSNIAFKELFTMFSPVNYQLVIKSVEKCAGFDEKTGQCKKPGVVRKLFSLLIKALNLWQEECELNQRLVEPETGKLLWRTRELDAQAFRHAFNKDYPKTLNYLENGNLKATNKDQSNDILDNTDVKKLYKYLEEICSDNHKTLSVGFNFVTWKSLAEGSLTYLQVFNGARPGEVERLTIDSFNNIEAFDKNTNPDIYKKLTIKQKRACRTYELVVIRDNTLVISPLIKKYIETVIQYRQAAGVHEDNPFVFGLPGSMDVLPKCLQGYMLMVKFSAACGAKNPKKLRARTLRKHRATLLKRTADQGAKVDNPSTPQGIQDDTWQVGISPTPYVNSFSGEPQGSSSGGSASLIGACSNISHEPSRSLRSKHVKRKAPSVASVGDSTEEIQDGASNSSGPAASYSDSSDGSQPLSAVNRISRRRAFVERKRWTTQERSAVRNFFGVLGKNDKLPSLPQCKKLIDRTPCLSGRKPLQIISMLQYQQRQVP